MLSLMKILIGTTPIFSYSGFMIFIGVLIYNTGLNVVNAYSYAIPLQSVMIRSALNTVSFEEKSV